jgi:hypothetical protein
MVGMAMAPRAIGVFLVVEAALCAKSALPEPGPVLVASCAGNPFVTAECTFLVAL